MSVRPITISEEQRAYGEPYTGMLATIGITQGVLYFLHFNKIPFKSNWFANPKTIPSFFLLTAGGFVGGMILGKTLFGDSELYRLAQIHEREKTLMLEGQMAPTIVPQQ